LILTFTNEEVKIFDVITYLDKGFFKQLKDRSYFKSVKPFMDISILNYKGKVS